MKIASVADVKAHFSAYLKESEAGPIIITRNGRPAAILLNMISEDELEGLLLAYSPKFQAILQTAREEIHRMGGIPHDEFWQQVDAKSEGTPINGKTGREGSHKKQVRPKSLSNTTEAVTMSSGNAAL